MEGSPLRGPGWADFGRRRGPRSRRALSSLRSMPDPAALESASHADRGRLISGERWPCRSRTRVAASRVEASAVTAQLGRPEGQSSGLARACVPPRRRVRASRTPLRVCRRGAAGGFAGDALFGAWWLDPVVALLIAYVAIREGREAWRGDACCAH